VVDETDDGEDGKDSKDNTSAPEVFVKVINIYRDIHFELLDEELSRCHPFDPSQ
jgi:hypothetical protein